jgi:putative RNA 2'-phosphotransferase
MRKASQFLSYVLRHNPESIGLQLDNAGWADINELIRLATPTHTLTRELLRKIVAENDKQRFRISDDGMRIRASQGHSITVDLQMTAQEPPELLFHGTAIAFNDSIREKGLLAGSRNHVHLSTNFDTARVVGARHGDPMVLAVYAREMHKDGYTFSVSDNAVWLTDHVPPKYIQGLKLPEYKD